MFNVKNWTKHEQINHSINKEDSKCEQISICSVIKEMEIEVLNVYFLPLRKSC